MVILGKGQYLSWQDDMAIFTALLALLLKTSRSMVYPLGKTMRTFGVSFILELKKLLNKQSNSGLFATSWSSYHNKTIYSSVLRQWGSLVHITNICITHKVPRGINMWDTCKCSIHCHMILRNIIITWQWHRNITNLTISTPLSTNHRAPQACQETPQHHSTEVRLSALGVFRDMETGDNYRIKMIGSPYSDFDLC